MSSEWSGNGSGMFLSSDGYFVTNYHVIEDVNLIQVEWRDSSGNLNSYTASVERLDESNDLAICRIQDANFNLNKEIPYAFKNTGGNAWRGGIRTWLSWQTSIITGMILERNIIMIINHVFAEVLMTINQV